MFMCCAGLLVFKYVSVCLCTLCVHYCLLICVYGCICLCVSVFVVYMSMFVLFVFVIVCLSSFVCFWCDCVFIGINECIHAYMFVHACVCTFT